MRNEERGMSNEECGFFGFKTKKWQKIWCNQKMFVILQPLTQKSRKVGRVIDRAGLEIRYTLFGYRGFESLTFR